ncbi:alpha/beta fold hydrolase [Pseudonocardia sp.]|uniref:alpha/beta fold hydrolase n=1 Tax=Pseudonocardia sp. TaxID=60912 RepID=UPI003D139C73
MTRTGVDPAFEQLTAVHGPLSLAVERGPGTGEPLLLVMGLGMQMHFWHDELVARFAARGFATARFDNRDVGLSTHLHERGTPALLPLLLTPGRVASYRIEDMAGDAVAVLDALGWASAHVVGVSMGGMIAQALTIAYPQRVRSLTSIMSTPSPRIGRPNRAAARALLIRPARSADEAAERIVAVTKVIGSPGYPMDVAWLQAYARRAFARSNDPGGVARQLAAINASPSRVAGLRAVAVPTLVVHGAQDPLVRPSGGRATAAAVPGSRLMMLPGMGHSLPRELWGVVVDAVAALADRAR